MPPFVRVPQASVALLVRYRPRYYLIGETPAMTRADKTLEAMRANPYDWRIGSLEAVAKTHGVNVRKSGGSHPVFERPAIAEALSVPARRPIKPVYVRRSVVIDAVKASDG